MRLKFVLPVLASAQSNQSNEIQLEYPEIHIKNEHFYGPARLYSMARKGFDVSKLNRIPVASLMARGFTTNAEYWTQTDDDGMIVIPWTFDRNWPDSLPCNKFGVSDPRAEVREAMERLNRDFGCYKMVELVGETELSTTKFENGLVFIYQKEPYEDNSGCSGSSFGKKCFSAIGRAPSFNQLTDQIYPSLSDAAPGLKSTWQSIGMANACFATGTTEHEVLHAMGVMHEHQAPDSDKYLMVDRNEHPLLPHSEWLDTYPYELNSVMHYGARVLKGPLDDSVSGKKVAALRSQYANGDGSLIWPSNLNGPTTTDMLEVQQMCRTMDSDFVLKETVNCLNADRFGVIRPVFTDRLCDGFRDCDDGSDEGDINECAAKGGKTATGCCSVYSIPESSQFPGEYVWDEASSSWKGDRDYIGKLPSWYNTPDGWYIRQYNSGSYFPDMYAPLDDSECPAESGPFVCVVSTFSWVSQNT